MFVHIYVTDSSKTQTSPSLLSRSLQNSLSSSLHTDLSQAETLHQTKTCIHITPNPERADKQRREVNLLG